MFPFGRRASEHATQGSGHVGPYGKHAYMQRSARPALKQVSLLPFTDRSPGRRSEQWARWREHRRKSDRSGEKYYDRSWCTGAGDR